MKEDVQRWWHVATELMTSSARRWVSRVWPLTPSQLARQQDEILATLRQGGETEAEAAAAKLLARTEARYGPHAAETAGALELSIEVRWIGARCCDRTIVSDAKRLIALHTARRGPTSPATARAHNRLACVLAAAGELEAARREAQTAALALAEHLEGEHAELAADAALNYGLLSARTGEHRAAIAALQDALARRERLWGADSQAVAECLLPLAHSCRAMADAKRGQQYARRALELWKSWAGARDPRTAEAHHLLGTLLFHDADRDGACREFLSAVSIFEEQGASHELEALAALDALSFLKAETGALDEAKRLADLVLERRRLAEGADPELATALLRRAGLASRANDLRLARDLVEEALTIQQLAFGEEHAETLETLERLALLDSQTGRPTAARQRLRKVLAARERQIGREHPKLAEILDRLARLAAGAGLYGAAQTYTVRLVQIEEKVLGMHHPQVTERLNQLAILLAKGGDDDGARTIFDRALTRLERAPSAHKPTVNAIVSHLSGLLKRAGDEKSLRELLERAFELQERAGKQPPFPLA